MNPILEYWEQIESGQITVSRKVKRVYEKLVADLNNQNSEWEYNEKRANHAITFIERYCKHSKGKMGGKPFVLELWQKAMTAALFGFVHKIDGIRKYREIILIVARKNGKSTWASAVSLYMLMADGEQGPEVVSAATKREQAKIVWSEAKRMVKKSPSLSKRARTLVSEIVCDYNDGSFKPLSSDSNTLDGLNPSCSCIDELHAIEDRNLYDVIIDGMTSREQPLSIITSTAGTFREGIFDLKYDEATEIINSYDSPNGVKPEDERVLPIIYELDSRDEWQEPQCWPKANPGLGTVKDIVKLRDKVEKAKRNPLLVKNLLCKDFNIRETSSQAWLTMEQVVNPATYDLKLLKPRYGIGGVDLSITTDLTSACILFMLRGDETIYYKHMYWLPEDLLESREKDDNIPYTTWQNMGFLRTTPGNKVNYKFVVDWFTEIREVYDVYIPWIGYDNYSAEYFVSDLRDLFGSECPEKVEQGAKTLSEPLCSLGADLSAKRVNYNNNPITRWCLSNVAVTEDRNANLLPCKTSNPRRRIDGFASMLDAYVVLGRHYQDYMSMI